jgi:hypothetical protein
MITDTHLIELRSSKLNLSSGVGKCAQSTEWALLFFFSLPFFKY